jgi:hypothetical protein
MCILSQRIFTVEARLDAAGGALARDGTGLIAKAKGSESVCSKLDLVPLIDLVKSVAVEPCAHIFVI